MSFYIFSIEISNKKCLMKNNIKKKYIYIYDVDLNDKICNVTMKQNNKLFTEQQYEKYIYVYDVMMNRMMNKNINSGFRNSGFKPH